MNNDNLFVALRAGFPVDLDGVAIEAEGGLVYTWRDIERATAMIANLLVSLELPPGSRVAVHTDKSVETLLLYLATLRAGFVYMRQIGGLGHTTDASHCHGCEACADATKAATINRIRHLVSPREQ